ncbi:MAG: RelA/SpoT domain-containing protein [Candidatus Brocadiia bacterium]
MTMSLDALQKQYSSLEEKARRFSEALVSQCSQLLRDERIPLGVPIEHRVKSWESLSEKVEQKKLALEKLTDLSDLVGIRLVLLFKRDVEKIRQIISETFSVVEQEDTGCRLKEDQFGYQSLHLVVSMPPDWLKLPTYKDFAAFKAEIQIRTLAQHIWAGASHHLQYKQDSSVPAPVQRSIYRVSALLETVDLEFERVLSERETYVKQIGEPRPDDDLNVDLLERVLDELLPPQNKEIPENYGDLLCDLKAFEIDTVGILHEFITSTQDAVKKAEAASLSRGIENGYFGTSEERSAKGVFFTHVGLVRSALEVRFGDAWHDYVLSS